MIGGASIVCLSLVDWSFNRQLPHEIADSLAGAGNRVLFVENTGVRAPVLRDAWRLWARARNWWRSRGRARPVAGGVHVLSPVLVPYPYSPAAQRVNSRILCRAIRAWAGDAPGPLVVLTFAPTPLARLVIRALRPELVVYYCADLISAASPATRPVWPSERALLAEADLVLTTSHSLQEMAARATPRARLLEGGVHAEDFVRARGQRDEPHPTFPRLSRPVVGFIGSLRGATDLELLARVAELAPELQLVLVGPRFVDVTALLRLPNVHVLNAIPHHDVMPYMVRFDVGLLPYVIDPFTDAILPAKVKEYLAAGLPVVSTSMPEVWRFAERHPGLITLADDPAQFVMALRAAVAADSAELRARRIAVAREYDWSRQMATLHGLMEGAMDRGPEPATVGVLQRR